MDSEVVVDWMAVDTVDLDLLEDGELCAILASCEFVDFLSSSWFLTCKLVAREGQNLQSLVSELGVHLN